MRSRWFTGTLTPALALVVLTGCGGGVDAEAVAWADSVCGALAPFSEAAASQPVLEQTDPVGVVSGYDGYLGSITTALDTSLDRLAAAGPAPVEGGDEYVAKLRDTLTQIRTSFGTTRTQLAEVDTSSIQSVTTALPAAVAPLQELANLPDPTEGLQANEELRTAADRAPNCQKLRTAG